MNKKDRRCKNGHPIDKHKLVLMGRVVGSCGKCRKPYIHSELPVIYSHDEKNTLGEKFHTYNFHSFLICGGCGSILANIKVSCKPMTEEDWIENLSNELSRYSIKEKKDETPVEDIRSTSDNGSNI